MRILGKNDLDQEVHGAEPFDTHDLLGMDPAILNHLKAQAEVERMALRFIDSIKRSSSTAIDRVLSTEGVDKESDQIDKLVAGLKNLDTELNPSFEGLGSLLDIPKVTYDLQESFDSLVYVLSVGGIELTSFTVDFETAKVLINTLRKARNKGNFVLVKAAEDPSVLRTRIEGLLALPLNLNGGEPLINWNTSSVSADIELTSEFINFAKQAEHGFEFTNELKTVRMSKEGAITSVVDTSTGRRVSGDKFLRVLDLFNYCPS